MAARIVFDVGHLLFGAYRLRERARPTDEVFVLHVNATISTATVNCEAGAAAITR